MTHNNSIVYAIYLNENYVKSMKITKLESLHIN